jgi:hypothetical protein
MKSSRLEGEVIVLHVFDDRILINPYSSHVSHFFPIFGCSNLLTFHIFSPTSDPPSARILRTRAMINEEMPFNKSIALQKLTGHQLRKGGPSARAVVGWVLGGWVSRLAF